MYVISQCSISEPNSVLHFVTKEIKGRTTISNRQNFENKAFLDGFHVSDSQNKRKIQTENKTHQEKKMKNQ